MTGSVAVRGAGAAVLLGACLLAACGSATTRSITRSSARVSTLLAPSAGSASAGSEATAPAVDALTEAMRPRDRLFPSPDGRTLRQLAALSTSTASLNAGTGSFTPGSSRYAFGLIARTGAFIYAPTAIYVASSPNAPAQGPFLAPADSLRVAREYRSVNDDDDGPFGLKAIYETTVALPRAGVYALLSLTRGPHGLIAGSGELAVERSSPIPNVGSRPPALRTDTLASVHGDVALLTTRRPAEDMHAVSFSQVLGRRPIALLISTPQLCTSRVCGPVTDIMVALQHRYGSRITFIHQEVFVGNDPARGLRPQLRELHLRTEPWLFTIDRRGIIAARLDGPFGVLAAREALQAALR